MIKLEIISNNGEVLFAEKGDMIDTVYTGEYNPGDKIVISKQGTDFLNIKLDNTLKDSLVFSESGKFEFPIPFGELKRGYDKSAFSGDRHKITVYEPEESAIYTLRNIALNSHDLRSQKRFFPHAYANLVTREDPCFFERNAIDGVINNTDHGDYPYHSWAGGAREDLEYYIDFGTEVQIERIVFYLRADFPHDTYWKSLQIEFDDKSREKVEFSKTEKGQEYILPVKKTSRKIHFTDFKQAEFPFSWAALSGVEVYGRYIKEDLNKMEVRFASHPEDVRCYDTNKLREKFHIS
ncbi:MAG: hypothetical protein J5852_03950, partial [Clostridia bacterium]|nr:hypothetical protein [Clostridia bacterium]